MPATKKCTKCQKTKRLTSFHAHSEGKYGVRAKCKVCLIAENKARAKANDYYYKPKPNVITPTTARLISLFNQGLKECSACKEVKKLSQFQKKAMAKEYTSFQNLCNPCLKQYKKEWHLKRNLDIRVFLFNYRIKKGCVDCGNKDPRVLEFDHLRNKKFNLGRAHMMKGLTIKEVRSEVRKCAVRCGNCHKKKTHKEQDTWLNSMYEQLAKEGR